MQTLLHGTVPESYSLSLVRRKKIKKIPSNLSKVRDVAVVTTLPTSVPNHSLWRPFADPSLALLRRRRRRRRPRRLVIVSLLDDRFFVLNRKTWQQLSKHLNSFLSVSGKI